MTRTSMLTVFCLVLWLALCSHCFAQQPASADLWRLAPPNSLLIAGFDARPDNPSVQAIMKVQTQETRDALLKQQADLRKAVEDLSLLFGISLDFAKDVQSWADQQWAVVIVPEAGKGVQPVLLTGSKDAAAAKAAVDKLLAPWQRIGDLAAEADTDYPISSFKMKNQGIDVYVSAAGPVVAISPSKDALKQALKGGGFAAGSAGDKTLSAVAGSMFYAYMDPGLLKLMHVKMGMMPVAGFGLGVSAVETGVKLRLIGMPTSDGAKFLKQMLPADQATALVANAGMPSGSLIEATFPNLGSFTAVAGMFGMTKHPIFGAVQEVGDTQISGALTAALPIPAGFVSAMAESDQAAADKLAKITESLKSTKLLTRSATVAGMPVTVVGNKQRPMVLFLAQVDKHIVLASDQTSLTAAAATIKGQTPTLAQSQTYQETMAGLDNSNLITLYANLAPVQGVGYLADGFGIGNWPLYGSVVKGLENMQALGLGAGFDGQMLSATLFLRAKPEIGPTIGPAAIGGTAIGAAILFPVFARAREAARASTCGNNLRELAVATHIYTNDWNDTLPSSTKWQSQLKPYIKAAEPKCPSGDAVYAFNKNLGGMKLGKIPHPESTVMFFEAEPGLPNRSGSRADAILPHNGMGWFAFADGHVKRLSQVPPQSQWVVATPKPPVKKATVKKPAVRKPTVKNAPLRRYR